MYEVLKQELCKWDLETSWKSYESSSWLAAHVGDVGYMVQWYMVQ